MKIFFQQYFVRFLLFLLRSLILVKRYGGPLLKKIFAPPTAVGRFLLRTIGVPVYRLIFKIKNHFSRIILPAKSRVLYLVSNRFVIHGAIIAITLLTIGLSFGQGEVRAETFGTRSLLYSMVAQDDFAIIEVVSAAELPEANPVSYLGNNAIDPLDHLDIDINYVNSESGLDNGSALASHADPVNVPKREAIIDYTIESGDTLGGISEKFGLSLSTVLWANDLTYRSTIQPGDTLKILPVDGLLHTVKDGDTLNKIANSYNADVDETQRVNKLASRDDINIGEVLLVPGGEKPAPVAASITAPVSSIFTAPSTSSTAARGSSTGSGDWVWPSDWRVITQYYSWRHTGLDIDGDYNTNNYAAAAGVVTYSGWYNGYGYTVDIDHGDGIMTRYAHHSKLFVDVGDTVYAGQALGKTGTTGRSTGTHLHFEVRVNGVTQNPLDWIR
ncbi:peptidoglycan DD-metalloendopeptidase family protein [Patescibacteria group bacterium]|nr:peptidoglycan DD-metalloendopeptidase family protein [Patescibacteria group bacterium]MBU1705481.1 peptidoglycan DD-metalloendopeptidase family protein [Patescibacteria group bacterium]